MATEAKKVDRVVLGPTTTPRDMQIALDEIVKSLNQVITSLNQIITELNV